MSNSSRISKPEPTPEQIAALNRFAAANGEDWKMELNIAWSEGTDEKEVDSHLLRQVRNTFGPTWLLNFELPE